LTFPARSAEASAIVYQPSLDDFWIHKLWLLKKRVKKPMTILITQAVEKFVREAEETYGALEEESDDSR